MLFSCLFLVSFIFSVFSGNFVKFHAKGAGADISYSYDFTTRGQNDPLADAWKEDLYKDEETGEQGYEKLLIPYTKNCLTTFNDNSSSQEGYVLYKFSAGENKAFTSLDLSVLGRVFHYNHDADCDTCFMKIYIGESADDLQFYTKVSASEDGTFTVYSFDLMKERKEVDEDDSEVDDDWWIVPPEEDTTDESDDTDTQDKEIQPVSAKGYTQCFIKIVLSGNGDWVCIEKLFVDGKASYTGYENPDFKTQEQGDEVRSVGEEVTIRPVEVYSEDKKLENIGCKIIDPNGNERVLAETEETFTVEEFGKYEIRYTANDDGRIYTDGYFVYGVENADDYLTADKIIDPETGKPQEENNRYLFDNEAFLNEKNYLVSENSNFTLSEKGVIVDGTVSSILKADFSTGVNLSFDIKQMSASGSFEIALVKEVGEIDFDTKKTAGLYFKGVLHEGKNILLTGFFSDGKKVSSLTGYVFKNAIGSHGLGVKQRSATDTTTADGAEVYLDGERYSSYYTAVNVFLSKIAPSGTLFVGFRVKGATVEFLNLVGADTRSPELLVADGQDFEKNGMVGDRYYLPDYTVFDRTDGDVKYTVSVKDPNGEENEIEEDENGEYFDIKFKGRYSVVFTAYDYSGSEMKITRNVTTKLKTGAPEFTFSKEPAEIGRKGQSFKIPTPKVKVKQIKLDAQGNMVLDSKGNPRYDTVEVDIPVKVVLTNPTGGEIELSADTNSFVPANLGVYTILYSAENEIATTQELFEVTVKLDADAEESREKIFLSDSWKGGKTYTERYDEGLCVFGTTYSEYPFEMSGGIEFTLDLRNLANKKEKDGWISLGIGSSPKAGGFGDTKEGYLYFMFYREDGKYYCNVNFHGIGAESAIGIFGPEDLGTTGFATISIAKITDSTTYDDNVNLYVNRKKIAYGTEKSIVYSEIVDDENCTYLSFYSFGAISNPKKNNSVLLKGISACDLSAPTIRMKGDLPTQVNLNEKVKMPTITLTDANDKDFRFTVGLYAPSGKEIDFSNGSFKAQEEGVYHLVIKAYDESGNSIMERYEIQVKTPVYIKIIQKVFTNANALTILTVTTVLWISIAILLVVASGVAGTFGVLKLRKKLEERRLRLYYSKRMK